MSQTTAPSRHRRADAQRNYERLLAVARAAVSEHGGDVTLEDIARDAGVGIGTLYRHFPTRQDLLEAVFLEETNELRERAEDLAGEPAAFDALVSWLRLQMAYGARGRSMGAAVMNAKKLEGSEIYVAYAAMREAGGQLLRRAQEAGEARPELDFVCVLRLVHGIVLATENADDPERAQEMFDVVMAGIRAK
jgi:AcrR family transcriptional regulator